MIRLAHNSAPRSRNSAAAAERVSTPQTREQMTRRIDDGALRSGSQAAAGCCCRERRRGVSLLMRLATLPEQWERLPGSAPRPCLPRLTSRVWRSDVTVDPCLDSKCLLRESPEAYAAYCKKGLAQQGKEPGIASTCPAQAEIIHLDEQQKDGKLQECPEEAGRTRQAKMAGVHHRLRDLRLVLLRGLDSEPLEVLDDVLRLLEEATDAPATANTSE